MIFFSHEQLNVNLFYTSKIFRFSKLRIQWFPLYPILSPYYPISNISNSIRNFYSPLFKRQIFVFRKVPRASTLRQSLNPVIRKTSQRKRGKKKRAPIFHHKWQSVSTQQQNPFPLYRQNLTLQVRGQIPEAVSISCVVEILNGENFIHSAIILFISLFFVLLRFLY